MSKEASRSVSSFEAKNWVLGPDKSTLDTIDHFRQRFFPSWAENEMHPFKSWILLQGKQFDFTYLSAYQMYVEGSLQSCLRSQQSVLRRR